MAMAFRQRPSDRTRVHAVRLSGREEREEAGQVLARLVRADEEDVSAASGGYKSTSSRAWLAEWFGEA